MNISTKAILASFFLVFSSSSLANEDTQVTAEQLQYDNDKQESIVVSIDPYDKWLDYLDKYGIVEGENERNGRTFFIASGIQDVPAHPDSRDFIDARDAAYKMAVISAKAELAKSFGSWMESESELTETKISEDDTSQSFQKAVLEPISTARRAGILTDLALDDQIKKFDPTWDGINITKEEKVLKVVEYNQRFVEKISARARAYLQGTGTIFSAEGDSDGYSVVVGIVWSFKSAQVAEAIYNPTIPLPKGKKNPLSIKDRLKKLSDKKLAATMGTRIWWDEDGRPVIVSFSATDGRGLKSVAKKLTALKARAQIAQFVSEIIESDALANTDFIMQAYDNDSKSGFNNSSFNEKIKSRSKLFKLPVSTIHYRKFNHPYTGKKMIVNVMAWTPDSAALARAMGLLSGDQETEFNATKGGSVIVIGNSTDQPLPAAGDATPGLEGVSSDPDDF